MFLPSRGSYLAGETDLGTEMHQETREVLCQCVITLDVAQGRVWERLPGWRANWVGNSKRSRCLGMGSRRSRLKTRKRMQGIIGKIQGGTSRGGGKRDVGGRELRRGTSMSGFPLWATRAHSLWDPLGLWNMSQSCSY